MKDLDIREKAQKVTNSLAAIKRLERARIQLKRGSLELKLLEPSEQQVELALERVQEGLELEYNTLEEFIL